MLANNKHSTAHWEEVASLFDSFSDDELADYFIERLRDCSKDTRERVLMAVTVLQAKVVDFR